MKKIAFFTFTVLFALFSVQPVLAKEAVVQENNVNVRSGPGTDYDKVGQVNSEEKYEVIEEEKDWVKIQLDNYTGWVTKEFVSLNGGNAEQEKDEEDTEREEKKKESTLDSITIQHDNTQIRSGASTDYEIIAFVEKGKEFKVLSETNKWLEISDDEITGFVFRSLIENNNAKGSNGIKNKTIVIDAGHGGRDVGAIGITGSYERDIAYLTAQELEKELTSLGANVVLTRPKNEFVPLESRSALANTIDTDAFLSLHYNSFPEDRSATGIETYYYHEQYESLASFIQDEIINETDERDRGVSFGDLSVIRQNFKPGVLLELGFLSNEESEFLLQTTAYQKKIVVGIVNGLQKYFSEAQ